jgi:hypothetical protein
MLVTMSRSIFATDDHLGSLVGFLRRMVAAGWTVGDIRFSLARSVWKRAAIRFVAGGQA